MKIKLSASLLFPVILAAQEWTQLADFPGTKRDDGAAAVLNGKAYFGTGLQDGWSPTTDWHALDLYTFQWQAVPPMPAEAARQYAVAFAAGGGLYVFGGDNNGAKNDLYRFDPVSGTWTIRKPLPSKGLIGAAAMIFGDRAFLVGGKVHHDSVPSAAVWEYDAISDDWHRKNDVSFGRRWRSAASSLGGLGYVAGGIGSAEKKLNDFLEYDPGTDTWKKLGDLPVSPVTSYASLQSLTNKLVFFGGQDSLNVYSKELWYYRVAQADWQRGPDIPSFGRRGGMSAGFNEKFVYVCGLGPGDQRLNESWMLDLPLGTDEETYNGVTVFPNPFSDELCIRDVFPCSASLTDCMGKRRMQVSITGRHLCLSTHTLPAGFYILELSAENGSSSRFRVIKK